MRSILVAIMLVLAGAGAASAAPRLSDQTNMSFEPSHGTQIEYLQPDGATFLWYPGNTRIVAGQWKTEGGSKSQPAEVCFRYGANTYDPVTRQAGGKWECTPAKLYASGIVEQAKGDVFGLAKGPAVPFVLSRNRTSVAGLKKGAAAPVAPDALPSLDCASVLANETAGRTGMIMAGILYYHGKWMGKKCVPVDYLRAFALLREARDVSNFNSLLSDLRQKAGTGNPKAVAALKKLDLSPIDP